MEKICRTLENLREKKLMEKQSNFKFQKRGNNGKKCLAYLLKLCSKLVRKKIICRI